MQRLVMMSPLGRRPAIRGHQPAPVMRTGSTCPRPRKAAAFSALLPPARAPGPHNSPVRIVPLSAPPGGGPGPAPAPGRWPHRAHAQDGVGGWHAAARVRAAGAPREAAARSVIDRGGRSCREFVVVRAVADRLPSDRSRVKENADVTPRDRPLVERASVGRRMVGAGSVRSRHDGSPRRRE